MSRAWIEHRKRKNAPTRYFLREKINGKQVVVVKNAGCNMPIAEKVLIAYENKKAAGVNPAAQALTIQIEEALEAWVRDEPKEPETIESCRNTIKSFMGHAQISRVNEIDKTKVDAWRYAMESGELQFSRNGKTYHRYSESTIWTFMKNLSAFLKFCFRSGWVSATTASMIRLKTPRATRRFLTKVEVARLIKACRVEKYLSHNGAWHQGRNPTNSLRKIMLFGIYTGMRVGEVLRAKWENITTEENLKRAPNGSIVSETIYVLFIPVAKEDKQRSIAIHPKIARILGIHKYYGKRTGSMFSDWTEGKLSQARRRAVKRASLERVRFHDLRHTFVRNYLKSQAGDLAQARGQTGHSGLAGLQPYAHFSTQDLASTISKMKIQ